MIDPLLEPFKTKNLTFKNRMVHAPTTMNMSDDKGYVTQKAVGAYEALAAGGFGAVCQRRLSDRRQPPASPCPRRL